MTETDLDAVVEAGTGLMSEIAETRQLLEEGKIPEADVKLKQLFQDLWHWVQVIRDRGIPT